MSVITNAILRVMSVGDPFTQEDTVYLNFSTNVDIARFELGLPITRGNVTAITDSVETECPQYDGVTTAGLGRYVCENR